MFWSKITVMAIFTEIYSFKLNVAWDTNPAQNTKCCTGKYFIQFLRGTDRVYDQNMFVRLGV